MLLSFQNFSVNLHIVTCYRTQKTKTFPILTDRKGQNLTINNLLKN